MKIIEENCIERTRGKKCLDLKDSRLKLIYIIGQRKAFLWRRIPKSNSAMKETVDIEIVITSRRKGDKKIM